MTVLPFASAAASPRMLLADDDDRFRSLLRAIFEPYFALAEVPSGEEALEVVTAARVDLVLCDMHMETLTGLETIRQVKILRPAVPCILITADATDELAEDAAPAAFDVLKKPIRRRELLARVSDAWDAFYGDENPLSSAG